MWGFKLCLKTLLVTVVGFRGSSCLICKNVDEEETNKLVKLVLFNNDVDVAFKLLIDRVEFEDNEFKLLNIVDDVVFKLLIDRVEFVDNEFKLVNIVDDVVFKLLICGVCPFTNPNIVVDVACKFDIFKVEVVERLFKFVVMARSGLFIMLSYIKLVKPVPEPTI